MESLRKTHIGGSQIIEREKEGRWRTARLHRQEQDKREIINWAKWLQSARAY